MISIKQIHDARKDGVDAEGWVDGVRRGGFVLDGFFYFMGRGPERVPTDQVEKLKLFSF